MTAALIYNPVAGKDPEGKKIRAVREILEGAGISHHLRPTQKAREGVGLAKEAAASGSELVIVAGGDGTVNEAVNGLVGTKTRLAIIPLGTGNLAAYEFGIPLDPLEAARAIPESRVERIDVGKANDRYFLMMASIGLDAQALRDAPKWAYRFLHWWAFYGTGLISLFRSNPFPVTVEMEKEALALKTRLLVISNIRGYGLPGCQFFSGASVTDGLLDLGYFKSQTIFSYLECLGKLGRKRPIGEEALHHHPVKKAVITTEKPIPVEMDGDFYGYTPLEISVIPKSLSILTLRE